MLRGNNICRVSVRVARSQQLNRRHTEQLELLMYFPCLMMWDLTEKAAGMVLDLCFCHSKYQTFRKARFNTENKKQFTGSADDA